MKPRLKRIEGVVSKEILDALYKSAAQLQEAGVRHALIGALAVGAYGFPRATKDVDFLVGPEAFEVRKDKLLFFAKPVPFAIDKVPVDCFAVVDEPHLMPAIEAPKTSQEIPIAPVEIVIYLKLRAGRRQDAADVARLLERADIDIEAVRQYLEPFEEESELFERLVSEVEPRR